MAEWLKAGPPRNPIRVEVDVGLEQALKVLLIQNNHVIEEVAPKRADESFNVGVLPRTSIRDPHLLNPTSFEKCLHTGAIDAVIIAEQVARLQTKRHRLSQLPNNPLHRWRRRHREMDDFAAPVVEDEENVEG